MAMAAVEPRLREEKVKKLEDFVDRRLKPDLVNAIAQRDTLFQQQKTFLDLKRNIENLEKNGVTSMRSMVNLGSEVYMQAEVPDTRHIFVDIGLGFHVEFTWQEALQFISVREARLARSVKVSVNSSSYQLSERSRVEHQAGYEEGMLGRLACAFASLSKGVGFLDRVDLMHMPRRQLY